MSRSAEEILEFDRLREILGRYTTCAPGRRGVEELAPSHERAQLEAAFAVIREAIAYLRAGSELGFGSLADPEAWLARLDAPGAVLSPAEILDAASLLDTTAWLKQQFRADAAKYPRLAQRTAALADFGPLTTAIRRAILPNGEISDAASSELKRIRTNISRTRDTIQKTLRQILRARGEEPGTDYVTLRNDRFVIPVRAADRRQVQGVMHGSSATGQTVFLEPLETIELNNNLVQLAEDEAAEIARILRELTERLQRELGALRFAAAAIAELDSTFARARFAREFNCALPVLGHAAEIKLEAARHPVLEDKLRREGRTVVPMTLALGGEETVLVISGPNTGGKTVALKTVGLAALAAQSGIPVAAESAQLPLFDRVLADIGDEQSIAADLSTFSAHVLNLKSMLDAATERSLVLVDEMGTGTAPEEGSALGVSLLEEFRARRCLTLATTHHDRLKAYASSRPGVLNAAVEFDEVHLQPTYRLRVGVPGGSSGIEIARRLGLPEAVIERARAQLAPETHEAAALIAYLHRSRDALEEMKREAARQTQELDQERRRLQSEWVERQRRRLAGLEQKFVEALKQHEQEIARAVETVKDHELRAQLEKQAQRCMVKARGAAREEANAAVVQHLADSQQDLGAGVQPQQEPVTPEKLLPGTRVRVRGFGQPVVLRRRDERSAEIEAGPLRMKVALDDITAIVTEPASRGPAAKAATGSVTVHAQPADEPAGEEINVIGCTVEEATRRADKFLDQAALAGKPCVRIIHGHGTGALRRGLAEFLAAHPLVERFHSEEADRGGAAITVVELKG
ncbi:MAG: endonuclease MutS2 [Acidobacteria bacterium]|nr:endonuclease MutS2 [Acidobacteriota bacterium]